MSTCIRGLVVFCLTITFFACELDFSSGQGKFIPNAGQWNDIILSKADITGGAVFLCKNEIRYNFYSAKDIDILHDDPYHTEPVTIHHQAFFFQWIGANPQAEINYQNEYPEYYNFYIGKDSSKWKSGLKAYSNIYYHNLYQGIDLQLSADGTDLEYTYTVQPGTDPSTIKISIEGAEKISIKDSNLHIYSPLAEISEKMPFAYQVIEGIKVNVPCSFLVSSGIESFIFPNGYNKDLPLVIDPVVIFATYSGSYSNNFGFTGTYDSLGYSYAGGDIFGAGFPTTAGAFQTTYQGGTSRGSNPIDNQVFDGDPRDVGLLKFTPDGRKLVYATYLGGTQGNEQPSSLVVDKSGNLVIFGSTASTDFPVTSTAFQSSLAGATDLFISKLSPDGKKLLASTYIGGTDFDGLNGLEANNAYSSPLDYNYGDQFRGEIVADKNNNLFVATSTFSGNFPVTSGCFQYFAAGGQEGCVFKIDSNLQKLIWSTYLGGTKDDAAYSLALDHNENVYVCGGTLSPYFFPSGSGYQKSLAGNADGFICRIKNDGSTVLNATYFGTSSYDQAYIIRLDNNDNPYVLGQTLSGNFLIKNVKYSNPHSGDFITRFNQNLDSIVYSTVIGSGKKRPDISPSAFLIDKCERVYISGWGGQLSYPYLSKISYIDGMPITSNAFQTQTQDSSDFYLAVFEKNMDTLLYASYFGGPYSPEHVHGGSNDFDKNGIVYQSVCGGCGGNSDFPTTPGAWSRVNKSTNCNNVMFKIDLSIVTLQSSFSAKTYACYGTPVSFKNTSKNATGFLWNFGDSSPVSNDTNVTHKYAHPGIYNVTLIAYNSNSCIGADTFNWIVHIYQVGNDTFSYKKDPCTLNVHFLQTGQNESTRWTFGDGTFSDSANVTHSYRDTGTYKIQLLADSGTQCADSSSQTISIKGLRASFLDSFKTCSPAIIYFINQSIGNIKSFKWYLPFVSTDTAKNPVFNFGTSSGMYTVSLVIRDSAGCKDSVSKSIKVYSKPFIAFKDLLDSCAFKLSLKNQSGGINNFTWYFSDSIISKADSLTHIFHPDSILSVTLITDSGYSCSDTLKKTYKVTLPKAAYNYSIDTCTGKVLFGNLSTGAAKFLWKFDAKDSATSQNALFVFKKNGKYPVKLEAISSKGCLDSSSQVITISKSNDTIYIPNIFTPNGDVHNNIFKITGLDPCDTFDLSIFNRWGQEFYHASGTNSFTWNGIFHGIKVPEGVYYYVLKGHDIGQMTGTITVVY